MRLQWVIVALLVIVSAVYASWRLLSARRRLWLLEHLLPADPRAGAAAGWRERLRRAATADAMRGCQGCAPESRARR